MLTFPTVLSNAINATPRVAYQALLLSPLCTFVSVAEIAVKTFTPHPKQPIGHDFNCSCHRYIVEKTYAEMACNLVWIVGHIALLALYAYRRGKGEALYQQFKTDNTQIAALKDAANIYRHEEAIRALGMLLKEDQPENAIFYLKADVATGNNRSCLDLGQLYLITGKPQLAKAAFSKDPSSFAKYLAELSDLLQENAYQYIANSPAKFDTSFNDTECLALTLAVKTGNKTFFECAYKHLPAGAQKAVAAHALGHFKEAAELGHPDAIYHYALQLKTEGCLVEANTWLAKISYDRISFKDDAQRIVAACVFGNLQAAIALGNHNAMREHAVLLKSGNNFDEAREWFESIPFDLLTIDEREWLAHVNFAGLFGPQNLKKAVELYNVINRTPDKTKDSQYFGTLAQLLTQRTAEERTTFFDLASTYPYLQNPTVCKEDLAFFVAKILAALSQSLDLAAALFLHTKTQSPHPTALTAALQLAKILALLKKPVEAIKTYQEILNRCSEYTEAAIAYFEFTKKTEDVNSGYFKEATEYLKKVVDVSIQNETTSLDAAHAMYLWGGYLLANHKKEQSKQLTSFLSGKENMEPKNLPGQDCILKAAQLGHQKAREVCLGKNWSWQGPTTILRNRRGRSKSNASHSTII